MKILSIGIVLIMKSKLSLTAYICFGSVETTTWVAPIFLIISTFAGLEVNAVTSYPNLFKNYKAKCPRPPLPQTAVFIPSFKYFFIG